MCIRDRAWRFQQRRCLFIGQIVVFKGHQDVLPHGVLIGLFQNFLRCLRKDVYKRQDGYIIYADLCALSNAELQKWNITFKKIPRDIAKI